MKEKQSKAIKLGFGNIENQIDVFSIEKYSNTTIEWADPIGCVMLKSFCDHNKIKPPVVNEHLLPMLNDSYVNDHKPYTPIMQISSRGGSEKVRDLMSRTILHNFSHLSTFDKIDFKKYIDHMFSELIRNVADHSQSSIGGYAMAQYYPDTKKVQFAVADRGVGFLHNIGSKYASILTQEDAIIKAMERSVTATSARIYDHNRNAGYGLYTIWEIIKRVNGTMIIISNDTLVKIIGNKTEVCKLTTKWDGVVVAFEFLEQNINYEFGDISKLWAMEEDSFF